MVSSPLWAARAAQVDARAHSKTKAETIIVAGKSSSERPTPGKPPASKAALLEDLHQRMAARLAGQAQMVDVAAKSSTHRVAVAAGRIDMLPATLELIRAGTAKKGDVIGIARVAAIQGAKRTSDLIPLCHRSFPAAARERLSCRDPPLCTCRTR